MFADNNQRTADYYYRPSMVAPMPTLQGMGQVNPSGKTVQDFLPKDWYDSAVYRNILDMLNTIEVAMGNMYNAGIGQFIAAPLRTYQGAQGPQERCGTTAELAVPTGFGGPDYQAFWGYAASRVGAAGQDTPGNFIWQVIFKGTGPKPASVGASPYLQKILRDAGYQAYPGTVQYGWNCKSRELSAGPATPASVRTVDTHNKRIKSGLGYSNADITNLVRSLDWEMNRVHLPLPFNLRQWVTRYNELSIGNVSIAWAERIKQLRDLAKWLVIMREKVRQAIDASNLARKVAEESLRKENAAIIQEQEAQRIAREQARRQQIEQERIAAEKLIAEEKKRLMEQLQAEIEAAKKEALQTAQTEIQQRKVQPVAPVAIQPEVTPAAPVAAPAPIPAPAFKPPALVSTPPVVAPEPIPATPPRGNALPLLVAGAAALFFMS